MSQSTAPVAPVLAPAGEQGNPYADLESPDSESQYSETMAELDSSNLVLSPAPYLLADNICTPSSRSRSRVARKWARKCANRVTLRALRASARRAAAPPTVTWADVVALRPSAASLSRQTTPCAGQPPPDAATVPSRPSVPAVPDKNATTSSGARRAAETPSSRLAALVNCALQSSFYPLHAVVVEEDQTCTDSGATGMMLEDYVAFVLYRKFAGQYVEIGDDTRLPIAGAGTAKFLLNRKVVVLHYCMHVPGLRAPLYSLCRHRRLPGRCVWMTRRITC